jgi:deoxyribose-phosphate aldolase
MTSPAPDLARFIQHTLIQPGVSAEEITRHCEQAVRYGFDAAMVPAVWVPRAREILSGTGVKLASALDFPLGCMTTAGKVAEARALVSAGAEQLDIGVHTGLLRSGFYREQREELYVYALAALRLGRLPEGPGVPGRPQPRRSRRTT